MCEAEPSWRKLDNMVSIALREADLWARAVFRLGAGIAESRDNLMGQIDAMLIAVAYRNVHRAARLAVRHLSEKPARDLRRAIERADRIAHGALQVRDMLEHFDDYEQGMGRLQQPGDHRRKPDEELAQQHHIYFERAGETFTLVVGGHRLSVDAITQATRLLVDGIYQAGNADMALRRPG